MFQPYFFLVRLKTMQVKAKILDKLLESWKYLYQHDEVRQIEREFCACGFFLILFYFVQAVLLEGVENLLINLDLKRVAQKALETASENLKRDPYSQRSHSILFVKNKLLAMCSRYVLEA